MSVELVVPQYSLWLVLASFVISMCGAFVALGAAAHIRPAGGGWSYFNLGAAALALGGVGIWCTHFIGMVAFRIPVRQAYAIPETLLSFVAAVGVSGLAFWYLARRPFSLPRLFAAGPIVGLAVATMHYLGMVGIRFPGYIEWALPQVALSVVIAVVAATAALWLAFNTWKLAHRLIAAMVMAGAVCAMHYTGMEAASFFCSTNPAAPLPGGGALALSNLGEVVFAMALVICGSLLVDQFMSRYLQNGRAPASATDVAPRRL